MNSPTFLRIISRKVSMMMKVCTTTYIKGNLAKNNARSTQTAISESQLALKNKKPHCFKNVKSRLGETIFTYWLQGVTNSYV